MLSIDSLLRTSSFVNGFWVDASSGDTFGVENPADGTELARVSDLAPADALTAVDAAHDAFPDWSGRTAEERASLLARWHDLIVENAEDLALLMTLEQGKPLREARGEVAYGAAFVKWFAEEARRAYGDIIPPHDGDKRILALRQPIGVVLTVTPWNFPIAMITRKAAAALAAGCTVISKPAEDTPLSALALARLSELAGLPPGVFNVVPTSRPAEVVEALMADTRIRKVSFTGSTEVGKIIMRQAADSVKRVSLELGGNAPFIVFDDADVEAAARDVLASKYRNAGQTCVCANRIYVQDGIYDAFLEAYGRLHADLRVGPGIDEDSEIGPLINQAAVDKVTRLLAGALERGARVSHGGRRADLETGGGPGRASTFFEPTIVEDADDDMEISRDEIFGPVSVIYCFKDEHEVIRRANDTPYGLAAYFHARDHARIWRVSEALEYGMVGVNTGMISTPVAPFGGVKESGFGREGSRYGLDEYLEIKYVCIGGLSR